MADANNRYENVLISGISDRNFVKSKLYGLLFNEKDLLIGRIRPKQTMFFDARTAYFARLIVLKILREKKYYN
ncbi:hypothetical protein ACS127_10505 [Amphibacillus sp. Q70]|uniref:hypothetical protein n=1 Tax=Amphibacillus sp. Q70 TaxID=3453416 RepID=UPI003F8737AD